MNELKFYGNKYLEYNDDNQLTKLNVKKSNSYGSKVSLSLFSYVNYNLCEIEVIVWNELFPKDPYIVDYKSDTVREILSFSDYDSLANPYRGLIYLDKYRAKSLSMNNYREYQSVKYNAEGSIGRVYGGANVIESYNDNDYPLNIGFLNLLYNCD